MPTTNPVPSQDPSDLLFNAGKLDEVLNGAGNSFTDRLGVARRTVAGMNADFDAQLADAESDLNVYRADAAASAAQAMGYLNTIRTTSYGAYASDPATDPLGNPPNVGDEYFNTTANLLKRFNGTTWQASDINTANLAAPSGSSIVGHQPAGTGAVATTVQDALQNTPSVWNFMTPEMRADALLDAPVLDHAPAFQSAVNDAVARGIRRIFIQFGRRQRYRLGSTVVIGSSGFTLFGDVAPIYSPEDGGYIFAPAGVTSLFDYGNGQSSYGSNQFVADGLAFYSNTGLTQNAIKFTQNNNGPHRGFLLRNCAGKGFLNIALFDVPTGSNLSVATVDVQSCVFSGNTNTVNAVERAFGLRYVGNQSEQGARITGFWDAGITITDNMLEGQSNPINIDSNSPNVTIQNNYLEAISGDYIARIRGTNSNAVINILPNYISNVLAADIFRIENVVRVIESLDLTIPPTRKSALTFKGGYPVPGSKIRGRFYVGDIAGELATGLVDPTYVVKSNPTGAIIKQDIGTVALDTPFGQHKTGATITGFPSTYFRANGFSYSAGDVVVACALVNTEDSGAPYMGLYNQSSVSIGVAHGQITMTPYTRGWYLMFAVGIATQAGTQLAFRFGSNGTSTSATQTLNIAAVGGYTIPAAGFETFNGQNRYPIELINPLDLTKPLEGSTTYDPPSLAAGAGVTATVTVLQAVVGDYAEASFGNDLQGVTVTAWVSAANTISVRFQNDTGTTIDLASGILRARVRKV